MSLRASQTTADGQRVSVEGEVADDALMASTGLRNRRPKASVYLIRVGRPTAFRLGGRSLATRE